MNWLSYNFSMLMSLLPFAIFVLIIALGPRFIKYNKSKYKIASGNGFFNTILNVGNYGEFLTYTILERLPNTCKILTNIYIPRSDGTTTEIDLVFITEVGIYVIESKNYSGWIFGDEKSKNWTQSMPNKTKNKFLNPIIQNKVHINALKELLNDNINDYLKSLIVFSERCELKKIPALSSSFAIIKRNELHKFMLNEIKTGSQILALEQVNELYNQLSKYGNVSYEAKQEHIANIKEKTRNKSVDEK